MILCYHKVHPVTKTIWWLSADTFYRQMAALKSRKVVFLDEYDSSNPDHVVITFDGVYDNVLEFAVPILEHFGYPFELFVIGDHIGKENLFDQQVEPSCYFADLDALDEMVARGGRVQWHTRTHKRFSELDIASQKQELTVPDELIARFGAPHLKWFAYPHGAAGDDSRALVNERFVGALACDDGDTTDRYYLPRQLVFEHHDFFKGRVSAIIANYNYGRFLLDAVNSLECQSVAPDEVLIIDDASTDDSSEILNELEARGYRVERNSENLGIVGNFSKAVSLTSGDYIFFLGADNRLRRDFVLECRVALDSHAHAAVAYTDMLLWGARSGELARSVGAEKIGRSQVENWDIYHWRFSEPTADTLAKFATHNFVHGSSMYRRSYYDAVGGYKKSNGPEDHHLFYRMWQAGGGLTHVPLPVLEYRQHSAAQANTTLGAQLEARRLRDRVDALTREHEDARAHLLRELNAERSLTHSLTDTTRQLVLQLQNKEEKFSRDLEDCSQESKKLLFSLEEQVRVSERLRSSLDHLCAEGEAKRSEATRELERQVRANQDLQASLDALRAREAAKKVELQILVDERLSDWVNDVRAHTTAQKNEIEELKERLFMVENKKNNANTIYRSFGQFIRPSNARRQVGLSEQHLDDAWAILAPTWYEEQNHEVRNFASAWECFRKYGLNAGHDPHPLFNGQWYLAANPDVAAEGRNPFKHYLESGAREGRSPHPLFDGRWYLEQNPDVAAEGVNPLRHYIESGAREGRRPHPLFDGQWYLSTNPDVAQERYNPLSHYVENGAREGRSPHPLFHGQWYLEANPDVASAGLNPLSHYIENGAREGRKPHPLFDGQWYLSTNPDIASAGLNPLSHYIENGAREGRNPHPLFDGRWYLEAYPDVAEDGLNPLRHYLEKGGQEGRSPHPLFDGQWYLEANPDVAAEGVNPLLHYIQTGAREGRSPHSLFDRQWYLEENPDVAAAGISPLQHYMEDGAREGRSPHLLFDGQWYLKVNRDVAAEGLNPLKHYLEKGAREGRSPHPLFDGPWYLAKNPDVAAAGLNPLRHYLEKGAREGSSPHPLFDGQWYLAEYPDVAAEGVNPLCHYIQSGAREGRNPHQLFSARWYRETYPEISGAASNPLIDYLEYGAKAGRNPNPLFDSAWYLKTYPDVARAGQNPLVDYVVQGDRLQREPNAVFRKAWYLKRHPTVATAGLDPLAHAIRWSPDAIAPGFDADFYRVQTGLKGKNSAECLAHYLAASNTRVFRSIADVDQERLNRTMGAGLALDPQDIAIGMVLYNEDEAELRSSLESIRTALRQCGPSVRGRIYLFDNSDQPCSVEKSEDLEYIRSNENTGFGGGHNALSQIVFAGSSSVYIGINSDGFLHRDAIAALLRMHQAQSGQALIEALQFPEEHPKFYDPENLETPWISCACYLMPRAIYEATGGFDHNIFLYCEDVDLSWSARRAGFRTMICPAALFFHDVSDRGHEAWRFREMLVSGRYLAYKWGNKQFREWTEDLLIEQKFARHRDELPPLDDLPPLPNNTSVANFEHGFSFALVRW